MKRSIFFLLWIVFSTAGLLAQQISVKSFRLLEREMTARIDAPKRDQNGDVCAIIKVGTSQTGFVWEPDGLGIIAAESKTGEYWLYVPYGAKRITIKHAQLGILRDYLYTIPIEKATVYEMVLTTGKVNITVDETIPTKFVIITSTPPKSEIFINDMYKGRTPFQGELPEGEYSYRIEKDMYAPTAGRFVVDNNPQNDKIEINASLKPEFGFARIITRPDEGMDVLVDGIPAQGKTPLTTDTLKPGKHLVAIQSPVYKTITKEIDIVSGETTTYEFDMKSLFGSISLETTPENGAAVIIDGKNTGQVTPCQFDKIATGEHTISFRKEWYEPKTIKVMVKDGGAVSEKVELKKNFCEVTLKTDPESELFVNNESKGKGTWSGRLIAGFHSFEARKDRHRAAVQKLQLAVGETKSFTLEPVPMLGTLKIKSNVIGAEIFLDNVPKGKTPAILKNVFAGDYTLRLVKEGVGSVEKKISIEEGKSLDLDEFMKTSMTVRFISDPVGANVFLDNQLIGKTPLSVEADFGSHQLKMINGKMQKEQTILVQDKGVDYFEMDVNEIAKVQILAEFKGGKLTLGKDSVLPLPFNGILRLGTHQLTVQKGADKLVKTIKVEFDGANVFRFKSLDLIKNFYKKHPFTVSGGYHQSLFANDRFTELAGSGSITQDLGMYAGVGLTIYPLEIEAKAFQSGFRANNVPVFVQNAPIKHEGVELGLRYRIMNIGTGITPYIGGGYQYSRLHVSAANTTVNKEASYNTSLPFASAGLKIRLFRSIEISGEYKYAFSFDAANVNTCSQICAGVGVCF